MKLDTYRRKRDFRRTPEPRGNMARHTGYHYVIQKHDARRLHYDFRLELDGVLKSWAVPKGPSLDPHDKRLAVHVEDHPLDYGRFEGNIPKPAYGGGTVIVWDRGKWIPEGDARDGYRRGHLHFRLDGEKLRGDWKLVRTSGKTGGKDQWLLLKVDDAYASDIDIVETLPDSVASGRSIDDVRANRAQPSAARVELPTLLRPQLATLVERAPAGAEWWHEIKYDGYRVLCRVEQKHARLWSRNGKDLTGKMAALARAVERLPGLENGWLDGEVVALQADGRTSFSALQAALSDGRDRDLVYYLFDLPYFNHADLTNEPLRARKARLATLLRPRASGPLRLSDHVQGDGPVFHKQACEFGLEGVVSKRADSPYRGSRGADWVKSKCRLRQEFVVGGYSEPAGTRTGLGALLLGVYTDGELRYCGRVGTGFDDKTLRALRRRLDGLAIDAPAFAAPLPAEAKRGHVHWVKPQTIIEVEFAGWTHDDMVRQGAYQGIREDKTARDVVRERPASLDLAAAVARAAPAKTRRTPKLSHADKVLYPEDGLTKQDLARYYEAIADWFLPAVRERPLTLVRCPNGYTKECFFQKHAGDGTPGVVRRVPIREDDGVEQYMAVDSLDGVWALVQLGALEMHVWGARIDKPDFPDRLVFDLDPDASVPWADVVAAALLTRARLKDLGLESFPRTTGGKGLHVVVPLVRRHNWDPAKTFAKALAEDLVRQHPDRYTARLPLAARRGKIFIDYLRNGRGATAIASYSTRARAHAPVAMPLRWGDITPTLQPGAYTLLTVPAAVAKRKRDPWAGFDDMRQSLTARARRELGIARGIG